MLVQEIHDASGGIFPRGGGGRYVTWIETVDKHVGITFLLEKVVKRTGKQNVCKFGTCMSAHE